MPLALPVQCKSCASRGKWHPTAKSMVDKALGPIERCRESIASCTSIVLKEHSSRVCSMQMDHKGTKPERRSLRGRRRRSLLCSIFLVAVVGLSILCVQSGAAEPKAPTVTAKGLSDQVSIDAGPRPHPVPKPSPKAIDEAIRRGVEFLLTRQNANGSWGSERSSRPEEVFAPIPGAHKAFRAAVTALGVFGIDRSRWQGSAG